MVGIKIGLIGALCIITAAATASNKSVTPSCDAVLFHMHAHDLLERIDHLEEKIDASGGKLDKQQTEIMEKLRSYESQLQSYESQLRTRDTLQDAKMEVLELKLEKIVRNEMKDQMTSQIDRVLSALNKRQLEQAPVETKGRWLTIFSLEAGEPVNASQEWVDAYKRSIENFKSSIKQLRVSMRSGDTVQFVTFDAALMWSTGWFSASKIINSSYDDLTPGSTFNVFGIEPAQYVRTFYISRNHGGCDKDAGWMAVAGGTHCPWDRRGRETYPNMRPTMCPGRTVCNWHRDGVLAELLTIEALIE